MASPMSLREAVKIIDVDHVDDPDTHARARSIVDAAVEAHEKLEALNEMQWPTWAAKQRASIEWFEAYERLRALERAALAPAAAKEPRDAR